MPSKDVLNIVLAVVILWVGVFLCWLLYYAAQIMRQGYRIFKKANDSIKRVDDAVSSIKEKFEHSATYLGLVAEGVKELVKYLVEKKRDYSTKRRKKGEE